MSRDKMVADTIVGHLKNLKLPGVARSFRERARQARDEGLSYEEYLLGLLEEEIRQRSVNVARQRRAEAHFPIERTLDQFDFSAQPKLDKDLIVRLSRCDWVKAAEPILLAGPVGTGKTHLAIALGIEAAQRRHRVRFYRADDLVRELTEARSQHEVGRIRKRIDRVEVLIVDELGFVPFERAGAELLFNLLVGRYQRRATVITTNLPFANWSEVFGDDHMTAALLDRLGENAHVLTTSGTSHRTRARLAMDEDSHSPEDSGGD